MKEKKGMTYGVGIILIVLAIYYLNKFFILEDYTPQQIQAYIHSFGSLGPIIYIIMFTFVPLTIFPDSILAIAGGMCFGLVKGSIYTMIGALSGGTLAFFITRFAGKALTNKLIKKDIGGLSRSIEEKGFWIVLLLRLIPLFPYDIISYSAGLSPIKYREFLVATFLGIIPGILVFSNIGDKATAWMSKELFLSLGLLVALLIVSILLKNRFSLKQLEDKFHNY